MALPFIEAILDARDIYEDVSRYLRSNNNEKKAMLIQLFWMSALVLIGAAALYAVPRFMFEVDPVQKASIEAEAIAEYKAAQQPTEEKSGECEQNPFQDACR